MINFEIHNFSSSLIGQYSFFIFIFLNFKVPFSVREIGCEKFMIRTIDGIRRGHDN